MGKINLSTFDKKLQIISLIKKAAPLGGQIWQSGNQEWPIEVLDIQIDLDKNQFVIDILSTITLDNSLPIKILFFHRKIQFEAPARSYLVTGNRLWCDFPQKVFAQEKRVRERYLFSPEIDLDVGIKIAGLDQELVGRLLDFSHQGLGILLYGMTLEKLQNLDRVIISTIDQKNQNQPMEGKIVYSKIDGMQGIGMRIGILLDRPISTSWQEYLKRRSNLTLFG